MKFSLAQLQLIDVGVKVYNSIFDTNFKLVIQLYDSFYSCDFVKMQDKKLIYPSFTVNNLKPELVNLIGNSKLLSVQDSFLSEFISQNGFNLKAREQYESWANFPELLFSRLLEIVNRFDANAIEPEPCYPFIYDLVELSTGLGLPFVLPSMDEYQMVSLYQCE